MKILWVINFIPSFVSKRLKGIDSPLGGWVFSMLDIIRKKTDYEFGIVCLGDVEDLFYCTDNNIHYFVIPGNNTDKNISNITSKYWSKILNRFQPNIVHLQGTEFSFARPLFDLKKDYYYKIIISIQGLVSEYEKYYFGDINPLIFIKNITFKDLVRSNVFREKHDFYKRGKIEIFMLKNADLVIGRTDWDMGVCNSINVKKYVTCGENLRPFFYANKWTYKNCIKHSIFCSQGIYPIKGIHMMIYALSIVKEKYPDVMLYIAGYNILDDSSFISKIKRGGYANFLNKLINKYDLRDNIKFLGLLNEEQMGNQYLLSNCFVQPSYIENSPNSLGEAMSLGVPIIASFVGGTMSMVGNCNIKMYPYKDVKTLALYICQIFEEQDKIDTSSLIEQAKINYDRDFNAKQLIMVYESVA